MYTFLLILQTVVVLVLAMLVIMIGIRKNTSLTRVTMSIGFLTLIMNVGNLLELTSANLEAAMTAVKVKYLGAVYVAMLVLFFCIRFCEMKFKNKLWIPLFSWGTFVLIMLWTNDSHHLLFTNLTFVTAEGFPHAEKAKGIIFYLYLITNVLQMLASALILLYTILTTKRVKYRKNCCYVLGGVLCPFLAYAFAGAKAVHGFDILPIGVAIGVITILISIMLRKDFLVSSIAHDMVFENMAEPIIVFDEQLNLLEANKAAREILPVQDVMDGERKVEIEYVKKCIEKGSLSYESAKYSFEIRAEKIMDGKRHLGYALVYIDLTAEKEKLRQMEYLKNEADRANKVKSEFLANMSHEIRTPLNAIVGMNDMILRDSKDVVICEYAQDVKKSSEILLGLINDILDSAKISTGKLSIIPVDYNLNTVAQNLYNMMLPKAEEKHLKFVMDIDQSIPCLMNGDDVRVRQILVNIISNAIKYTLEGEVRVKIDWTRDDEYAVIKCAVSDTGIGIKKENLDKVMGRFERIADSRTRYIEGTGLGLSITMQLLNLMGSRLELSSEYGVGSTFSFQLRQKIVDETPISENKDANPEDENDKKYLDFTATGAKILVVDDNKINLKVFEFMLRPIKAEIISAESGAKTLELTKTTRFDLILMDHMMPEMDGIETREFMMQDSENLNLETPMIMLSANAIAGAREAYIADGFTDYLAKPIEIACLHEVLLTYLPKEYVVRED